MAKAYNPIGWENGTKIREAQVTISGVDYEVTPEQWDGNTPVDALNLDHMEKGITNSYDVKLLAYTDTAPSECETGDIYYNTTNKLLYKATGTNTWGEEGSEPLEGILYVLFDSESNKGNSYAWNGSDLSSVGGGSSNDIIISDEEPTTDDWKIWIDSGEVNNLGSEVVDSLEGNETYKAPSVRAIKEDLNTYSTAEQRIGTWIDGKPLYRKVVATTSSDTANTEKNTVIASNVSEIIKFDGFIEFSSGGRMPLNLYYDSSTYVLTYYDVFNGNGRMRTSTSYASKPITYIVEYTKTTD